MTPQKIWSYSGTKFFRIIRIRADRPKVEKSIVRIWLNYVKKKVL